MPFLLTWWRPIAAAVALVALYLAVVGLKHSYDEGKRDEGRAEVQAKFDAYVTAAMERTSAITLAWDAKRIEAETAGKVADDERAKRFAESKMRAQALPAAVAAVVVPAPAVGVLQRAIDDSAAATGPARESEPAHPIAAEHPDDTGAASTVGLLTAWGLEVVRLYDACRDQVTGWQAFYQGLQAAQEPTP